MILPIARRPAQGRSGITLMEILISIMIMGVGLVSLATLFPLGLMRIKSANDYSRSAYLTESASDEIFTRELLNIDPFRSLYGFATTGLTGRNPFVLDTNANQDGRSQSAIFAGLVNTLPLNRTDAGFGSGPTALHFDRPGPGLPIAYDPVWWSQVRYLDATAMPAHPGLTAPIPAARAFSPSWYVSDADARFGSGVGVVRDNASGPSAKFGLQRLTNFIPYMPTISPYELWRYTFPVSSPVDPPQAKGGRDITGNIFASPDDMVFQKFSPNPDVAQGLGSPILPDLSENNSVRSDWIFTWMLTGQLVDAGDQTVFEGNIVVHRNRQFGFDVSKDPAVRARIPAGETSIEAIFGYSPPKPTDTYPYYGSGDARVILLRWPSTLADPDVRVGSWIADVTYQQDLASSIAQYPKNPNVRFPGQRCYWYQVVKRTEPELEVAGTTASPTAPPNYRRMTITVATPVKAKTRWIDASTPLVETAVITNSVINVFPRTFTIK